MMLAESILGKGDVTQGASCELYGISLPQSQSSVPDAKEDVDGVSTVVTSYYPDGSCCT